MASTPPPYTTNPHHYHSLAQQQTVPVPAIPMAPTASFSASIPSGVSARKRTLMRIAAIALVLALFIIMYFIWNPPTTPASLAPGSSTTRQNFGSNSPVTTSSPSTTGGDIQVYVVGAVKHPGVYTLPPAARVYALLRAAGGPLTKANLVALNLAAALTDGEEVYVTAIGEVPPTYMGGVPGPPGSTISGSPTTGSPTTGQLVNINTASVDEMRQSLHVSSTTAQNIVNYRLQHGPYTSVIQLLQVVSKSIYNKVKDLVTV